MHYFNISLTLSPNFFFLIQVSIRIITQVKELMKKGEFTVSLSDRLQEVKGNLVTGFFSVEDDRNMRPGKKMQRLQRQIRSVPQSRTQLSEQFWESERIST